ncbi:MAG: hypothetical protein V1743_07615 [Nanoarchaeota archaeon]
MAEEQIQIPKIEIMAGKSVYANTIEEALEACQQQKLAPVFMPQLIDARIAEDDSRAYVWQNWFTALSIRAAGKTKAGHPVVVYGHVENYLSNPENVRIAKKHLVNNAAVLPKPEFQRLLDLEDGQAVFVVDYAALKSSTSGVIPVKDALQHPQTIPFLGGKERAVRYLEKHEKIYGKKIGVWYSDDLSDEPRGRLLFLGNDGGDGLSGGNSIDVVARFVGVRRSAVGAEQATRPSLEHMLKLAEDYVPRAAQAEYAERAKALLG